MSRRIDATPSWTATAQLLLVLLKNGNDEGKAFAESEILRMGRIIDKLQGEKQ